MPDEGEIAIEDLIANEGVIITLTHNGFIKRTTVSAYRAQRRGGKGVIGMTTREGATEEDDDDFIEHLFTASTHDYLMFFTKTGRCYVERVYEIPDRAARVARAAASPTCSNSAPTRRSPRPSASKARRPTEDNLEQQDLHVVFATRSGHREEDRT